MKTFAEVREFIYKERNAHYNKEDNVKLNEKQAEKLIGYTKHLLRENNSIVTIRNVIVHLKTLGYFLNKDFEKVTKDDLQKYLDIKQKLKQSSFNFIKHRIKVFYQWLEGITEKGKYPEIVDWIKIDFIEPPELRENELISNEETRNILIPACHNFQDKLVISLLRESAGRINEILSSNENDVRLENDRAFIKLRNSKRRNNVNNLYREIVLIDSFYYLEQWLRDHPLKHQFKDNKDIPLFVNKKGIRLAYHDITRLLSKLKKETNFKKKINPQSFRHSQATDMAKILTDAEMRVFGGWSKSSQIIGRYTHLTSDDVNTKRLQMIGRVKVEDKEKDLELLKPCPRCNEMMDIDKFKFCGKCGMSLNKEEEIKITTKTQELENKMDLLFKKFKQIEKKEILKNLQIVEKVKKQEKEKILKKI